MRPLPDAAYLRECFDYDPQSGELRWRERPREHFQTQRGYSMWNTKFARTAAGWGDRVGLDNRLRRASRIIWKLVTGDDPVGFFVDHKNNDHYDNRWDNLRLATRAQNNQNRLVRYDTDLPKGVSRHRGKFKAAISIHGRHKYLGLYDTVEQAKTAYDHVARRYHGEFFNPG